MEYFTKRSKTTKEDLKVYKPRDTTPSVLLTSGYYNKRHQF